MVTCRESNWLTHCMYALCIVLQVGAHGPIVRLQPVLMTVHWPFRVAAVFRKINDDKGVRCAFYWALCFSESWTFVESLLLCCKVAALCKRSTAATRRGGGDSLREGEGTVFCNILCPNCIANGCCISRRCSLRHCIVHQAVTLSATESDSEEQHRQRRWCSRDVVLST